MKFINMRNLCGVVAMAAAGGCASETPTNSSGEGSFKLVVSPLELDSRVDYACYAITVKDTDGNEVWSDDALCTTDWSIGDDETLSYVGLCEASGDGMNSVSIELTRLVGDDGAELGNWPADAPPTYATDFLCTANADAVVNASFLVIAPGTKGFLDLQVSVQEIECNAKVDCSAAFLGDDPVECAEGDDECVPTAQMGSIIVALACDAVGDDFTELMIDEVVLTCTDALGAEVVVNVDTSYGTGFHAGYPVGFVAGAVGNAGISEDGTSFYTLAIGIDPGYTDCTLSTRMAANDGRDMDANDQFPVIVATDIAFGFDDAGTFSCTANPLDGELSGLFSTWGTSGNLDFHACLNEDASISLCD